MNIEALDIEDLKVIRMGLNKVPVSHQLWETVKRIDALLAEHNLRFESVAKPKHKYQRGTSYEWVFVKIAK